MPKLKTKKTLLKRVKISKGKKILRNKIGYGHLGRKNDSDKKSRAGGYSSIDSKGMTKKFKKLLARHGAKI